MTDEMIALSRRVVACKGWRWMAGMATVDALRVVSVSDEHRYLHVHPGSLLLPTQGYTLPDLTDAATLGCLLALVRAAWNCAVITSPEYDYDDEEARQGASVIGWRAVETERWMMVGEGVTEAEALVAALESAP